MKAERSLFHITIIVICVCLLPVIGFILVSLWPQRELVSWLVLGLALGLATAVVLTKLVMLLIKTRTIAKVRMAEEALRPGRLYAHERLAEHEGPYSDDWAAQQEVKSEPYTRRSYVYSPSRHSPDAYEADYAPYKGLQSLSMESYDWNEEK